MPYDPLELQRQNSRSLDPARERQLRELTAALISSGRFPGADPDLLGRFLLPFLRSGLTPEQTLRLVAAVPEGWEPDHREIYYDLRLARWIRHVEPDTLENMLRETLESAPTVEEGERLVIELLERVAAKVREA